MASTFTSDGLFEQSEIREAMINKLVNDNVLPNLGDVIDASNGQLESDLSLDNPSDNRIAYRKTRSIIKGLARQGLINSYQKHDTLAYCQHLQLAITYSGVNKMSSKNDGLKDKITYVTAIIMRELQTGQKTYQYFRSFMPSGYYNLFPLSETVERLETMGLY